MKGHRNLPPSAIYPIFPLMICATSQANSNMSIISFGSKTAKGTQDPFSLDSWDPFSTLVSISSTALSLDNVQVDWKETPSAHVFKADLPGLKKDEVKVEVEEQRFLTISGERSEEVEEKDHKWHRVRRSFGKFLGSISLPEDAAVGGAKAALENGVLTVTVPKKKDKKLQARVIRIEG